MRKRSSLILLSLLLSIFVFTLIDASLIVGPVSISANKTIGNNITAIINITNPDSFTYYNVSIEDNNFITIGKIPQLNSGQVASIPATIFGNENANINLKVRGFYLAAVNPTPRTFDVNISSYTLIPSPCDFTIIKGDSVRWSTATVSSVEIRKSPYTPTVDTVATISNTQPFIKQFLAPEIFKYRFYVSSFSPGECAITVLDDSGYVNNPQNDGNFSLNLTTQYSKTSMSGTVLVTNYTMDFYSSQDGLMTVTNNGNETAHSIHLSGEWFTFNSNNFDLNPGETKGLMYTIKPIIFNTNETDKNYNKSIKISGNFNTLEFPINVFVKYSIVEGYGSGNTNLSSVDSSYSR